MTSKKGVVFGLIAGILWGLDGVLIGRVNSTESFLIATLLTACIHDGLAALWILIVNIKNRRIQQYMDCFKSKQFIAVFLCALLGGAAGMTLNVAAIRLSGASAACAVTSAYPVVGAVIGIIFLKEKCNRYSISGIVSVALGAVIIGVSQTAGSQNLYFLPGIGAAFAAMLCWALEGTLSKSSMKNISSDVLIGIRELISCLIYIFILLIILKTHNDLNLTRILNTDNLSVIIAASLAGAFSYFSWYRAMDISGVTVGMSLNATYALWAVIFDIPINKKGFSPQIFIGAIVILLATVLTIYSEKFKERSYDNEQ